MTRLYVESNFVLELVFAQQQREQCETLLDGAADATFELAIPSYCLGEPLETLGRRHRTRRELQDTLQREVSQLRRVTQYRNDLDDVDLTVSLFARSAIEDRERLERYYRRIGAEARLTDLTADVVERGLDLRNDFDLELQDAFVLASIAVDLEARPTESGFATLNTKDFDDPGVRTYLEDRGAQLLTSFGAAVGFALSGT